MTTLEAPSTPTRSWRESTRAFLHPRVITMLFLGFSAGIPILLIFSTLSLWLREADVSRSTVTFFSWAALGYSFKFIWAPIVDRLPLPGLTARLGRRRGWLLVAQGAVIAAILWMATTDPAAGLRTMALAAVLLGFSSATQDIVIDAYRIESADKDLQAMMSATYIAGYRLGMLVAGAGALKLAAHFGTTPESYQYTAWRLTYLCMAATMLIGVVTTLLIPEPKARSRPGELFHRVSDYVRFLILFVCAVAAFVAVFWLSGGTAGAIKERLIAAGWGQALGGFVVECVRLGLALAAAWLTATVAVRLGLARRAMLRDTYVEPVADFFRRYGKVALLILALIGTYRIADIVMGVMANVFYQDLGFTKDQIADVTKVFGLLMTILGGFLGGAMAMRLGVMRVLFVGAFLAAATNILFAFMARVGASVPMLAGVVAADNLSAGIASAAFVAYLSGLTSISFTAVQYAVFSSLMTLLPKIIAGYSGSMVDSIGYEGFFILSALLGLPVLILVRLAAKYTPVAEGRRSGAA